MDIRVRCASVCTCARVLLHRVRSACFFSEPTKATSSILSSKGAKLWELKEYSFAASASVEETHASRSYPLVNNCELASAWNTPGKPPPWSNTGGLRRALDQDHSCELGNRNSRDGARH